ncbi:MAG: hypothetical protein CL607_23895 [Anaerolineaceae bacterium]|nr:hypothetical protein [Anaerolineaceae bacterium]
MKFNRLVISLLFLFSTTILSLAQESTGSPIDFTGTVDSIDGASITVTGLNVDVSQIEPDTVARLELGMSITVGGTLNNGIVTAEILVLPEPVVAPEPAPTTEAPPPSDPVNVLTAANYNVTYNGSNFDGTQTTFTYTVSGKGTPTALSHFDLEIPHCFPTLDLIAFSPADAVELGVDPTTGIDGIKWDSPLGENESRTYSVTFLDFVAEGEVAAAVKNGDGFFTVPVGGPSCAQPAVDIEKYISFDSGFTWLDADSAPGVEVPAGAQVSYRLVVANVGNVPLTSLALTDDLVDTATCSLPAELVVDAVFECVLGPVAATESQLTNTASISAAFGSQILSDSDSASYFTGALPAIDVEKYVSIGGDAGWIDADATPGADAQVGDSVFFRFVVSNTGNVPLTGVVLADDSLDLSACAIPTELEPSISAECVVGPSVASENQHTNVATVNASSNGVAVSDSDSANYFGRTEETTASNFTIAFLGSVYANGQTTFSYGVVGNNTPPDLSHFDLEIPICPTPLQVAVYSPTDAVSFGIDPTTDINGIKWDLPLLSTSSRTYSITFEGNVALGTILAAVKAGNGFEAVSVPGPTCNVAQVDVEKSISIDGGASWLDADAAPGLDVPLNGQVSFRFQVRNEGNSELSGITLTDDSLDLSACTVPATLAVGGFFECVVGPMPIQAGQHTNIATARGVFGDGSGTTIDTDSANYFGGDRPAVDVQGYVSSNGGATWIDADAAPGLLVEPGIEVMLQYIVTNTGNITLQGLTLAGTLGNTNGCSIPATLEPGASFACIAGTVIVVEGQQSDTATVSASANGVATEDSDNTRFFGGLLEDDTEVIIIIEGPVDEIDGNTIYIFGFPINLDPDDPRINVIQIGDIIRIEGSDDGGVLIALVFIFTDVEIFVNNGIVWRDAGTCSNPPPSWAPAWGWRARCEGGGTTVIIIGGYTNVPAGCKLTGFGNGNIRIKCSRRSSRGSRRS